MNIPGETRLEIWVQVAPLSLITPAVETHGLMGTRGAPASSEQTRDLLQKSAGFACQSLASEEQREAGRGDATPKSDQHVAKCQEHSFLRVPPV